MIFKIMDYGFSASLQRKKLTMVVIPSIFLPEDWSFTFYEGLNRHPESIFRDKTIAELGCGNGWITIAIAEKWLPSKVYGLDINPRAVKIAWINLFLNALDENDHPIHDAEKKTLLDRVEFHESDLLAYCQNNSIMLERIVGCIPQILNPNPDAMTKMTTENASEEFLYSLSNYRALQNEAEDHVVTVIEAPRQSDLMVELIEKLKPQVVVTGIASFEAVTSAAFENLLDGTRKIGSRLLLDISDHFELSSLPSSNGVLKYLAGTSLPSHAAVVCGLLKNQVYSDLEVAFVISEDENVFQAFSRTVELLEGNTALISQNYYVCLFNELLSFQLAGRRPPTMRERVKENSSTVIGFSSSAVSVFNEAELSICEEDDQPSLIHMDVDQSSLPMPTPVKAAIFESFARQNLSDSEIDVTSSIKQLIRTKYGFPTNGSTEFLYSDYSLGLFNKLVLCCIQESGTICFPAGSNGCYVAAARFMKANVVNIPTQAKVGFKLTDAVLIRLLQSVKKPWAYIAGPTINPTGSLYSNKEMEEILTVCAKFGARVLLDTSFSGLEYDIDNWDGWNLEPTLTKLYGSAHSNFRVSLLGGLSIEVLTGGLAFGFLLVHQSLLAQTSNGFAGLSKSHSTVKYAMKKLLAEAEQETGKISGYVAQHKAMLKRRSERLRETLEKCGWEVLPSYAGVSMVAKPSGYFGKHVKLQDGTTTEDIKLTDSNIRQAIFKATGLCINSGVWTGIPEYCRFSIAQREDEFEQALVRVMNFKGMVN